MSVPPAYNTRVPNRNHPPPSRFSRQQRVLLWAVPPLAALLIRALGATLRFQEELAPGAHPADRDRRPDLYPFWHCCLLLAAYRYRNLGIHILISASFDGELIARTVARLGFVPVRGSSSRGGAAGLLALSRALAAGHKCAITADGPRGPALVAKPGAAAAAANAAHQVAQKTMPPATQVATGPDPQTIQVSAFHLHPERAWTLRSWDGFLIPKPFSRVTVAWRSPLDATAPDLPHALQTTLDQARFTARQATIPGDHSNASPIPS